jgi:putative transcriptional regulator
MADHYQTTAAALKGKLLVATPKLNRTMWEESVILVAQHSEQMGADGYVINRPSNTPINKLYQELDFHNTPNFPQLIRMGGPVRENNIAMIHSGEWYSASTQPITRSVSYSYDDFMLEKMAMMDTPYEYLMLAGMSQWAPGQLEREIKNGSWLVIDSNPAIVFANKPEKTWVNCLEIYSQTMFDEFF